jgi:hypothetical protein
MPIDVLSCPGHGHPILGQDDDTAFSRLATGLRPLGGEVLATGGKSDAMRSAPGEQDAAHRALITRMPRGSASLDQRLSGHRARRCRTPEA